VAKIMSRATKPLKTQCSGSKQYSEANSKQENQKTEFTIKCSLLNKMNSLGMPDAYKVGRN